MTTHLRSVALTSLLCAGLLGAQACAEDEGGGSSPAPTPPTGGASATGGGGAGASGNTGAGASGNTGTTSSGGSGVGASGGGGGAVTGDCPLVGTWTITGVACGFVDITGQYFDTMTSGTMTVTHLPVTGCAWTIENVSPACTKSESYETTDPIPGTISLTSHGIQSCDPAGCTFSDNDPPCELGLGAGTAETEIDINNGLLTTTGPQGPCSSFGFDTTVTWERVP